MELGEIEPGGKKGIPLHTKIFIGLILGAIAGAICQMTLGRTDENLKWFVETIAKPAGNVFLFMIFMVVVPLLFSALLLGVSELGSAKKIGRIGLRSLLMTVVLSGIAVVLGLTLVNVVKPGGGITVETRERLLELYGDEKKGEDSLATAKKAPDDPPLLGFIPKNPFKEINRDGLIPLMFFALIFGIALAAIEAEKALPVKQFFEGIFEVSIKIIEYAMKLAPFGVFFLIFATAATLGVDALFAVGKYVLLVLLALAIHMFVVYSLVIKLVAKRNPLEFFKQLKTVILTAFSTSSSNATLPTALKSAEEDLGLPRDISAFVLTIGATANQNGTALFEGITILFFAQLFGIDLSLAQQGTVMGLAIVAGIGTAGVPGGAWPMIATIINSFGMPARAIGLVFGIDRILDMSRTVLNVTGDITIAACVNAMEERSEAKAQAA